LSKELNAKPQSRQVAKDLLLCIFASLRLCVFALNPVHFWPGMVFSDSCYNY
jgi:hypothetical protein